MKYGRGEIANQTIHETQHPSPVKNRGGREKRTHIEILPQGSDHAHLIIKFNP